jgi:hypothetical protein
MVESRAHVALLVDFTNLRQSLGDEPPTVAAGDATTVARPMTVAGALVRYANQLGRVGVARAYADWTRDPAGVREVGGARLEPVLVPSTPDGEDRSHIRLTVEAMQILYTGDEPDAFVLVTSDPTLLPLVQALRADGSEVVLIAAQDQVVEDLREEADTFVALEAVLRGEAAQPLAPRRRAAAEAARTVPGWSGSRPEDAPSPRRERPPHPTPIYGESDFARYDWAPFVRLIDELEHRLPFVGVRYLVNKVLGPHNCGVDDPRLKRDLINRAVDDGLIEMYPVGNVADRSDPVTACRLDRHNATVVRILGQTTPPVPPVEETDDDED